MDDIMPNHKKLIEVLLPLEAPRRERGEVREL
jgi:hypothetical protein